MGVQLGLVADVAVLLDLLQPHVEHQLGGEVLEEGQQVRAVRLVAQGVRGEPAVGLGEEQLGVAHEVVEVAGCPEKVRLQQIHAVGLETGVGSCLAVVDEAQTGSTRGPRVDGLKGVARGAVLHIDHGASLEIPINWHIHIPLLLLSIRIVDLPLKRKHLLPILIPRHFLALLLIQFCNLLVNPVLNLPLQRLCLRVDLLEIVFVGFQGGLGLLRLASAHHNQQQDQWIICGWR